MLNTKLCIPTVNKNIISREKLLAKLQHAKEIKLTLVIAPAGYGKTTAVLDWLGKCGLPFAWLSLSERDNHPTIFWEYVCTALNGIVDGISKETEYVFSSQEMIDAGVHLNILIDQLSESTSDLLLVLDDLHLIKNPSILAGLTHLIDYLPPNIHLIFISRMPPELGLSRNRIKWQVQQLTEAELRFKEEEILRFYQAHGLTLENNELDTIEKYTEGWAAAMVAVAMSMEDAGSRDNAMAALTQSSRDIGQYLKDEVFSAWNSEKQLFAMKTSILDTLSEGLCNAVTENENGRRMLEEISDGNGFLMTLDEQKKEYRFHLLFKDFLYQRLTETAPLEIEKLQIKAGHWYREHDFTPEAIEYLLRGGSYEEAFELIEHRVDYLINKNDFDRLIAWIERLPAGYRDSGFKIAVIYAAYYAETGQYELSRQWISRMKALKENYPYALGSEWSNYSQTVCTLTEVNLLAREGKIEFVPLLLSAAESDGGKYYKMPEYFDVNISDVYFFRCPMNRITDLFKESDAKFNKSVGSYREMISKNPGYAPLAAGEYLYESNRLEEALPYLLKAQEEALEANCPGALVPTMVNIARLKRSNGESAGAFNVLEECEKMLRSVGKSHWNYLLRAFRCRLFMDSGNTDKVQEWFSSSKLGVFTKINRIREFELMVYARVLILLNRHQDAGLLLQRLLTFTGENGRLHSRVEVLNLLALLAYRNNHARRALKYIDESLDIGLTEGYVRSYLDEWPPMAQILRAYIKSRQNPADADHMKEKKLFAGNLLKQLRGNTLQPAEVHDEAGAGLAENMLEQLTEQEKKVLELMVNAATNQEICDMLGIRLWTVKTHTGNIYSKLGVKNRAQCIKLMRDMGLK